MINYLHISWLNLRICGRPIFNKVFLCNSEFIVIFEMKFVMCGKGACVGGELGLRSFWITQKHSPPNTQNTNHNYTYILLSTYIEHCNFRTKMLTSKSCSLTKVMWNRQIAHLTSSKGCAKA
jgi:hypothetical protein